MSMEQFHSGADGDSLEEFTFKPFEQTFKFVTYSMIIGGIYPNPKTEKWRVALFLWYLFTMIPITLVVGYDMYLAFNEKDMETIFGHTIVMGPFLVVYFKSAIMFINRQGAQELLQEINEYYEKLNGLPLNQKRIARKWLKLAILFQNGWSYTVLIASYSFPLMAIFKNVYSIIFDDIPTRYAIHHIRVPFTAPGTEDTSPAYEIIFFNTMYASFIYVLNFTGFDGFYVQSVMFNVMRIEVCGEALKDAFKIDDDDLRRDAVHKVIEDHIIICNFMDKINGIFESWFALICGFMIYHICSCVFHITQGNGLRDMEFMSAFIAAVVYVYMVCYCGGLIQDKSERLADLFYSCGWERVKDNHCRYLLVFMIARAQESLNVRTSVHVKLNLEMFLAIVKMAYSLLTLLQQT